MGWKKTGLIFLDRVVYSGTYWTPTDAPEGGDDDSHLGDGHHEAGDSQQPEGYEVHHQVFDVHDSGHSGRLQQLPESESEKNG